MLCLDTVAEVKLGRALGALRGLRKLLSQACGEDLLAQGADVADLVELIEDEFAAVIDPHLTRT